MQIYSPLVWTSCLGAIVASFVSSHLFQFPSFKRRVWPVCFSFNLYWFFFLFGFCKNVQHCVVFNNFRKMDLDDVLPHVGDWNRYQHLLLWLVCLPACIPCGFAAFNQVFMDRVPDHWCKTPSLAKWDTENRKAASIPKLVFIVYIL